MATFGSKYGDRPPGNAWKGPENRGGRSHRRPEQARATRKQMSYLDALGYEGPRDLSRAEASDAIEVLKRRRTGQIAL